MDSDVRRVEIKWGNSKKRTADICGQGASKNMKMVQTSLEHGPCASSASPTPPPSCSTTSRLRGRIETVRGRQTLAWGRTTTNPTAQPSVRPSVEKEKKKEAASYSYFMGNKGPLWSLGCRRGGTRTRYPLSARRRDRQRDRQNRLNKK